VGCFLQGLLGLVQQPCGLELVRSLLQVQGTYRGRPDDSHPVVDAFALCKAAEELAGNRGEIPLGSLVPQPVMDDCEVLQEGTSVRTLRLQVQHPRGELSRPLEIGTRLIGAAKAHVEFSTLPGELRAEDVGEGVVAQGLLVEPVGVLKVRLRFIHASELRLRNPEFANLGGEFRPTNRTTVLQEWGQSADPLLLENQSPGAGLVVVAQCRDLALDGCREPRNPGHRKHISPDLARSDLRIAHGDRIRHMQEPFAGEHGGKFDQDPRIHLLPHGASCELVDGQTTA